MLPYPGWVYKNNRLNVPSFLIEVDILFGYKCRINRKFRSLILKNPVGFLPIKSELLPSIQILSAS